MATLALGLLGLFAFLAFGVRVLLHARRTGSTGVRGISGRPGSVEWLGGLGFLLALAGVAAAPVLDLAGALGPIDALDVRALHVAGYVLFAIGAVGTILSQRAMGISWRIGVSEDEHTALVTGGPFAIVRNPIYAAMIPALAGIALLVPSVVALAALGLLVLSLEVQTRLVEEPHLLREHGVAYAVYARRVGRFLPWIGRLRGTSSLPRPHS